MILIVGLGNPGRKYKNTPHNLGFETLDLLKKQGNFSFWKNKPKFKAKISRGEIIGQKIILAKPQTFMNQSGEAVRSLKGFYKIPLKNIYLICDDFNLGFGEIKIKTDSGAGGHKGVKSVIDKLGANNFNQLKIGIGPIEPGTEARKFVLRKFTKEKRKEISQLEEKAALRLIEYLLNGN